MSLNSRTRRSHTICIQQGRCRLRQFSLENGESVIVDVSSSENKPQLYEFPFNGYGLIYKPWVQDYIICMYCCQKCTRDGVSIPGFHASCYRFNTQIVSDVFLRYTQFKYEPPLAGEIDRQRHKRLTGLLASNLMRQQWPKYIPSELWHMIAQHLVRECAIVTAQMQIFSPFVRGSVVKRTRDVYAHYTSVEGIAYLSSISNQDVSLGRRGKLLFKGHEGHLFRKIYIASDHFGIRDVLFTRDGYHSKSTDMHHANTYVTNVHRKWWRCVSLKNGVAWIVYKTDGIKVRHIAFDPLGLKYRGGFEWPMPSPPPVTIFPLREYLPNFASSLQPMQMCPFDLNKASLTGYSVAVNMFGPTIIHSHEPGMGSEFYSDLDTARNRTFWLYMPINKGEYIKEIWRYAHGYIYFRLLFITNRGRVTTFGSHTALLRNDAKRILVCRLSQSPTQIFFNAPESLMSRNISVMACENPRPNILRPIPKSVLPIDPSPNIDEPWFYSSSMDIIERDSYVAVVSTSEPVDRGEYLSWLDVPWYGTLEWWFSYSQTTVSHTRRERASGKGKT
ncbi:hypothetical protein F4774DRAFT_425973 [Daldinia eschscholtzii]|nr:hypothetical protein F4774DRAFT_425973 [Daldinia eschscholtzii]